MRRRDAGWSSEIKVGVTPEMDWQEYLSYFNSTIAMPPGAILTVTLSGAPDCFSIFKLVSEIHS